MRMKIAIPAVLALLSAACAVPRDTARVPWFPHQPTAWVTTTGGHKRDAGPFKSVQMGFLTDEEINAAVDRGYANFKATFPDLKVVEKPVALNDDYAMFVWWLNAWASGVCGGHEGDIYGVCIWLRGSAAADPGPGIFIVRPPGTYWGVPYSDWRYTTKPIAPALEHEMLHAVIGDPGHKDPRWKLVKNGE